MVGDGGFTGDIWGEALLEDSELTENEIEELGEERRGDSSG